MTGIEIVLCIAGAALFIISFLLPQSKEKISETDKNYSKEEIKKAIDEQLKDAKHKVSDILDETVQYTVEKAERSLERLSIEKINAVSEYADTIIDDINKNHQEVMFLYDMLNNKHENLKETAAEINQTTRAAKNTVKVLENTAKKIEYLPEENEELFHGSDESWNLQEENVEETFVPLGRAIEAAEEAAEKKVAKANRVSTEANKEKAAEQKKTSSTQEANAEKDTVKKTPSTKKAESVTLSETVKRINASVNDISFESGREGGNNNEKILRLHNQGKSNMAIAKELGLGVGEVKLVIDLFEGMSS